MSSSGPVCRRAARSAAAPALTARPRQARALGWQLTPYAAASGGFLAVSVLRHAWRPKCSGKRNSPASSILLSTKHWRYRPRRLRERIERCPQVRKSAPVRVHGQESARDSTTVTLAGQGLHTQVLRYTAFTCLCASRPG